MTEAHEREVWSMLDRAYLHEVASRTDAPVFATISGAHLYGFASPDSDVDLRGAFLLPARALLGLHPPDETITVVDKSRIDLDWVAHDLRKFVRMMVSHNGYVMEQLYSPLVVLSTPTFETLRVLGKGCLTRPTVRHYQGFARGRRKRLHEPDATVKHLLYAYRVLLSGIHLMRTGDILTNIMDLNETAPRADIVELVRRKREGSETMALSFTEIDHHARCLEQLEAELKKAHAQSTLPEEPTTARELEDLVIRVRLEHVSS